MPRDLFLDCDSNPVAPGTCAAARAALAALALDYESVAFAGVVEEPSLRAAVHQERRPLEWHAGA